MPDKKALNTLKPVITYIASGGTIAMERGEVASGPVPSIGGEDLLSQVSGLNLNISNACERSLQSAGDPSSLRSVGMTKPAFSLSSV